jgi:hypothetical protein
MDFRNHSRHRTGSVVSSYQFSSLVGAIQAPTGKPFKTLGLEHYRATTFSRIREIRENSCRILEEHYNNARLSSAIGYITPKDMRAGHQQEIQAGRDPKLEGAREQQRIPRQRAA